MKNQRGVVGVVAVVFIGLFALLSGLVSGVFIGTKGTLQAVSKELEYK